MKTTFFWLPVACASAWLLSACGGSEAPGPTPTSAVPTLAPGAYQVIAQGDTAGVGLALVGNKGESLLLLGDDGDAPARVMHVAEGSAGRRVPPAAGFVTLGYTRTESMALTPPSGTSLASSYQLLLGGQAVTLSLGADGRISPGTSTGCQLGGQVDLGRDIGGARPLSLTLQSCGTLTDGRYQGVLWASSALAPAAWQAVVENGQGLIDVVAYR